MSFGVYHIKAVGVAIIAAIPLAIGNPVALAATKDEVSRCRAIQQPIQRRDCFEVSEKRSEGQSRGGREGKNRKRAIPPAPDVATTSTVDRVNVAPGQPICVDRDALAAMLAAGVLASSPSEATTNGCQTIPEDAKIELLQSYPSGLRFLRVIRVKVTSPAPPGSTVGFTIETIR